MRGRFDSLGTLAVAGIIVLIGCVGSLQYRWISRASDADGERLAAQINRTADRITSDFERELVTIWRLFHVPPIDASDLEAELTARRDEATELDSGVIRRIVVIERGPAGASVYLLDAAGKLVASAPEGRFEPAVMSLVMAPPNQVEPPRLPPDPFTTLVPLPVGAPMDAAASRRATRFVVITLDSQHLERNVLPRIVAEAVGDEPLAVCVERGDGSVAFSTSGSRFAAHEADAVRTMLRACSPRTHAPAATCTSCGRRAGEDRGGDAGERATSPWLLAPPGASHQRIGGRGRRARAHEQSPRQ